MKDLVRRSKETSQKISKCFNVPCVEIKLSMIKLNLKPTGAPLKVGAGELTRV